MQTVRVAVFIHCARRGHQCLANDLAAVYPLPPFIRAGGQVVVLLDVVEIEQLDDFLE